MGKSTLVNSLFLTDLYKDRKLLNAEGESLYRLFSLCITHDERTALNNKGTLRSCLCVNQTTVSLRFNIIFVSSCSEDVQFSLHISNELTGLTGHILCCSLYVTLA